MPVVGGTRLEYVDRVSMDWAREYEDMTAEQVVEQWEDARFVDKISEEELVDVSDVVDIEMDLPF